MKTTQVQKEQEVKQPQDKKEIEEITEASGSTVIEVLTEMWKKINLLLNEPKLNENKHKRKEKE